MKPEKNLPALLDNADLPETDPRAPKGISLEWMIDLKAKGYNNTQIGKLLGCTGKNVANRLKPWMEHIENLPEFKRNKADVLAVHERRILDKITEKDIDQAGLKDKVLSFAVLNDKERLERGQVTGILGYADMLEAKKQKMEELKEVEKELAKDG